MRDIKYNKWVHKETGLAVSAAKYRGGCGMEDGFRCDLKGNSRPFKKLANATGFMKDEFLNESDYLIQSGKYLFKMPKNIFLKLYKRG